MEQEWNLSQQNTNDRSRTVRCVFAILLLFILYLCFTGLIPKEGPSSFLLLMIGKIVLFGATLVFALLLGGKINVYAVIALLFGVIASAYAWINGSYFGGQFLYFLVFVLSYLQFVLSVFGNHANRLSGLSFLLDSVKAAFVYPFISFTSYFKSLFQRQPNRPKRFSRGLLYTLIGIGLSVLLGFIVILILSYDPKFESMFRFETDWTDVPAVMARLILTIPAAALCFGAMTSSLERKRHEMNAPEKIETLRGKMKRVPQVVFVIPTATLLIIYGLFFFSQWDAYVSAFSGVLPSSFKVAEYARSGFFELCVVACINAAFCAAFRVFGKDSPSGLQIARKLSITLLGAATLVLIATALSKMLLYIKSFDLTFLRLFTCVVMILLAIGFLLTVLAQWIRRIRVFPVMLILCGALILITPFANVRGKIAAYNVDAYILRSTIGVHDNEIDYSYLVYGLGDAGIPDAIRLLESGTLGDVSAETLREDLLEQYLYLHSMKASEHTLASKRALRELEAFYERNKTN